jgi:hypothetical protein
METTGYEPGKGLGMIDVTKTAPERKIPVQPGVTKGVSYTIDWTQSAAPSERVEVAMDEPAVTLSTYKS